MFQALTTIEGLARWWTQDTRGVSDVGKTIVFQFHDPSGKIIGKFDMEVLKQEPAQKVQWKCVKGPEEWVGPDITFDLKQENDLPSYCLVIATGRSPADLLPTAVRSGLSF